MYIFGAGSFGRETLDALRALGEGNVRFLSDLRPERPVAAPVIRLDKGEEVPPAAIVIAVSNPRDRETIASRLSNRGWRFETVLHPQSCRGSGVMIGQGSILLALTYVSTEVVIRDHVHVNYGVTIGHDCILNDFVTVLPNATIGGGVHIGRNATIGSGAVILPKITIGQGSTIGAGAVVTRDVAPFSIVTGVPAKPMNHSK
jgi:sugar O-acyltransferase (sialic acid O-acetyltransferase NeuD family)